MRAVSARHFYDFTLDLTKSVTRNPSASFKGLKYITLALVSAQTLFMWLGDLLRYREQLNGNKNFGRSKQWYVKAQQLIPSNGKPYNQLAIVSIKSVGTWGRMFDSTLWLKSVLFCIDRNANSMPSTITCAA